MPSAHLSQAKRNHRQQRNWLKNHITRCRANDDFRIQQLPQANSSSKFGKGPGPSGSSSKFGNILAASSSSSKFAKVLAASSTSSKFGRGLAAAKGTSSDSCNLQGTVRDFACDLRFYNNELLIEVLHEQECFQRKRHDALDKLKTSQRKWRQRRVEWQKKQNQPAREAQPASKSSVRNSSNSEVSSDSFSSQEEQESESMEINVPHVFRRDNSGASLAASPSLCSESSAASSCSRSSPSGQRSADRSSLARSSTDDGSNEQLAHLAMQMQGRRRLTLTDIGTQIQERLSLGGRRVSLELPTPQPLLRRHSRRRGNIWANTLGGTLAASMSAGSPGTSQSPSSISSIGETSSDSRSDMDSSLAGEIDPTGESHQRERRRSIAQAAGGSDRSSRSYNTEGNAWSGMHALNWDFDESDEEVPECHELAERPDAAEFMHTMYQKMEEWRRDFPIDTLNELANAFESWGIENGRRVTTLGVLEDVVHVALGWSRRVVRNIAKHQGLIPDQSATPDQSASGLEIDVLRPASKAVTTEKKGAASQMAAALGRRNQNRRRSSSALLLEAVEKKINPDDAENQSRNHELTFSSVADLLNLVRNALELAEKEEPEVLWAEADYQVIVAVFKHAASAQNSVSVKHLIDAINALSFRELRLETALDQQRLVNITRLVLANRLARRQQQGKDDAKRQGTISFRDFVRVVSMALHDAERTKRMKEFSQERDAVKAFGFGLLEVEDMRELYESFCALLQPNDSGQRRSALDGMLRLLRGCSVNGLRAEKVDQLQSVVQADDRDAFANDSEISFACFIGWMDAMAAQGLADITFTREGQTLITMEDVKERDGFAATMIRENLPEGAEPSGRRSSLGIVLEISFNQAPG